MKEKDRILYLHIGLPKTGTSALQVFFARNAKELYRKGLRYPGAQERVGTEEIITSGNGSHLALGAFGLHRDSHMETSLGIFEGAMRAGDRNVLISSEYFSVWEAGRYVELKQIAAQFGFTVKILAYLRDQADMVVTHYFQGLKRKPGYVDVGGNDFEQYAADYIEKQKYLDFNELLEMLSGVYGKQNVRVRSTKRSGLSGHNIFSDFMEAVGISDDSGFNKSISKVNPTPTQQEMYIRAMMGIFHPTLLTSDSYLKVISKLHGSMGNLPKEEANFFIEPNVVKNIRSKFSESNKLMCDQWFKGQKVADVFERKDYGNKIKFDNSSMDINAVIAVLGGLLVDALNRIEKLEKNERVRSASQQVKEIIVAD